MITLKFKLKITFENRKRVYLVKKSPGASGVW